MKTSYEMLEMDVIHFEAEDVLTTSGGPNCTAEELDLIGTVLGTIDDNGDFLKLPE